MGYRNSEGFYDPTAGMGMRLAERNSVKHCSIEAGRNGTQMQVDMHVFFPCKPWKAACLIPMITRYGRNEDILKLEEFLHQFVSWQDEDIEETAAELKYCVSPERYFYLKRQKEKAEMLRERAEQNLSCLTSSVAARDASRAKYKAEKEAQDADSSR